MTVNYLPQESRISGLYSVVCLICVCINMAPIELADPRRGATSVENLYLAFGGEIIARADLVRAFQENAGDSRRGEWHLNDNVSLKEIGFFLSIEPELL